jgi:hypothetical protein
VLATARVVHFFTHELARLRRTGFSFFFGSMSAL